MKRWKKYLLIVAVLVFTVFVAQAVMAADDTLEKEVAELKLTKAVTFKKSPIRVNATYYIGIFKDAALTKLLYKKAMRLANASSMTSTLKINLYKLLAPHTITLYFAETDKNGKVASSGSKSGYMITIDKASVTLSPEHAEESVTITNDIIVELKASAPPSVKAKAKKNKVIVSWKKITDKNLLKEIRSIEVQYSTDKKFKKNLKTKKNISKSKTKITLKLKKKKTYYIRVRYKGAEGYSEWSKVKKVKTKK